MQETQVLSLVQEEPTYHGATKPVHRNCSACALKPGHRNYWNHVSQLLKSTCPRTCALQREELPQWEAHALQLDSNSHSRKLEKSPRNSEDPGQPSLCNLEVMQKLWWAEVAEEQGTRGTHYVSQDLVLTFFFSALLGTHLPLRLFCLFVLVSVKYTRFPGYSQHFLNPDCIPSVLVHCLSRGCFW